MSEHYTHSASLYIYSPNDPDPSETKTKPLGSTQTHTHTDWLSGTGLAKLYPTEDSIKELQTAPSCQAPGDKGAPVCACACVFLLVRVSHTPESQGFHDRWWYSTAVKSRAALEM